MNTWQRILGTVAAAGSLTFIALPAATAAPSPAPYVCSGGAIASGSYSSLTVKGDCRVAADAMVLVSGNVTVLAGAALDAQSAPVTVTVKGNVTAAKGSFVGLGCQSPADTGNSAHPCAENPQGRSDIAVGGNVTLNAPFAVMLNGIDVDKNVTVTGGGSPVPWTVKNSTIGGDLTMTGVTTDWLGINFNTIAGNVTLTGLTFTGTDDASGSGANDLFVVRNRIDRSLTCVGVKPGVFGYGNQVGRNAVGQCTPLAQ